MGDHLILNYHFFFGQQTLFNQGGFNNPGLTLMMING